MKSDQKTNQISIDFDNYLRRFCMSFSEPAKELRAFSKLESRRGHLGHITDKGGTGKQFGAPGIWDLGSIWEASLGIWGLGGIWEASGKHHGSNLGHLGIWDLEGIWEASGKHLGGIWGTSGGPLGGIWDSRRPWGFRKLLGAIIAIPLS